MSSPAARQDSIRALHMVTRHHVASVMNHKMHSIMRDGKSLDNNISYILLYSNEHGIVTVE